MTQVIERRGPNIAYSLFKWLQEIQYTVGAVTGRLVDFHAGLRIVPAYPDDLATLTAPTLAVSGAEDVSEGEEFYGGELDESRHFVSCFGFVAGAGTEAASRIYRDRLMNDLVQLLTRVAADEGMDLYDAATGAAIIDGSLDVEQVRARLIPVNAPEIEADRYKFLVTGEISYV